MPSQIEAIRKIKLQKVQALRKSGVEPYPEIHDVPVSLDVVKKQFDELTMSQKKYYIAGRVMARREHGGAVFVDINDGSETLQLHVKQDVVQEQLFVFFLHYVDIGDIIESYGSFFITRRGEQTQEVHRFRILAKALLPLPEKWHGLSDTEERFRKRYLDLLMNEKVREVFYMRSAIIRTMRTFLEKEGFLEVETPILQTISGGAIARPFKTKMHALHMDLYLRISPELYLKRLIVGGFQKVYEIGRSFRNEGMDATHNPEFTEMECYVAYENEKHMMARVERFMHYTIDTLYPHLHGELTYQGHTIHILKTFRVAHFNDLLQTATGMDYDTVTLAQMQRKAKEYKVEIPKGGGKGKIADALYKVLVRPSLIQPTFLIDHPLELSPLAKQKMDQVSCASRFQLIIGGTEMMNGYAELNDPTEQSKRFKAQSILAKKGDAEAPLPDEEFVEALAYGLPPTAGLGIGIERFIMFFTDMHSIREVMLFPTMKSKK